MTDWISKRHDLPTEMEVEAGNDLMTPGYPAQANDIVEAVKAGRLDMKYVDQNVRRMLEYVVKTPRFKGYQYSMPDLDAHAKVTRQSSTEGMVLLKNDGVLPIKELKTVALFGVNSYDFLSGGLGSGCVNVPYVVDMVQGLADRDIPKLCEICQGEAEGRQEPHDVVPRPGTAQTRRDRDFRPLRGPRNQGGRCSHYNHRPSGW